MGNQESIAYEPWPTWDAAALIQNEVEVLVQLCGKPRTRMMMPTDADQDTMCKIAMENPEVIALLEGKTVRKVIAVKGRLVNIVAN